MLFSLLYYQRVIDLRSDFLRRDKKKNKAPTDHVRELNEKKREELHAKCLTLQDSFLTEARRKSNVHDLLALNRFKYGCADVIREFVGDDSKSDLILLIFRDDIRDDVNVLLRLFDNTKTFKGKFLVKIFLKVRIIF